MLSSFVSDENLLVDDEDECLFPPAQAPPPTNEASSLSIDTEDHGNAIDWPVFLNSLWKEAQNWLKVRAPQAFEHAASIYTESTNLNFPSLYDQAYECLATLALELNISQERDEETERRLKRRI